MRKQFGIMVLAVSLLLILNGCREKESDRKITVNGTEESAVAASSAEETQSPEPIEDITTEDITQTSGTEAQTESVPETFPEPPAEYTISQLDIVDVSNALYTYESMVEDLNQLKERYPDYMTVETVGQTADGRSLYLVVFGNPDAGKQILIHAGIHAREYMTPQLVMKQLEYYCYYYKNGVYEETPYRDIFDEFAFYILPMDNPDGIAISQSGLEGLQNANLRAGVETIYQSDLAAGYAGSDFAYYLTRWKANACGVDLNRNFNSGWDLFVEHPNCSSEKFKGAEPESEPEVQALIRVTEALPNLQAAISYHSMGSCIYWEYHQEGAVREQTQVLAQSAAALTGYYLAGESNYAGYSNYCVLNRGVPSITVETGDVAAPLPISEFSGIWDKNRLMWVMLGKLYMD